MTSEKFKCRGSYIDSPDQIKNKNVKLNSINVMISPFNMP